MSGFPREFYLVTGLSTMVFIAATLIQPFFSLYVNDLGTTTFELGLIVSLLSYTTLLTRLPLGLVTNRFGSWWVVPLALIGQSSSYFLYGLVTNPVSLYPIRIFNAIALASLHPTLMSLVSVVSPEGRKGEGIGIYLTSVGLGQMFGPLLCSLLLSYFDYRMIFTISSMIPVIALVLYLVLLRVGALGSHFSRSSQRIESSVSTWSSLKGILTKRPIQALTYVRFTFAFGMAIIATIYSVYVVNNLGILPSVWSLLYTLRGLSNTLTRMPAGRISDKIGRKKPLIFSFALLALTFVLLSEVGGTVMIGAAMLLYGLAHGTRAVSEWAFLGDVISESDRSLANSYFSSIFDLGNAIGATIAGSAAMLVSTPMILKATAVFTCTSVFVVAFTKSKSK
jgi:predicted MFS family arabinose efflux permease